MTEFTNVTDGRTDKQTLDDGICRACIASREKTSAGSLLYEEQTLVSEDMAIICTKNY